LVLFRDLGNGGLVHRNGVVPGSQIVHSRHDACGVSGTPRRRAGVVLREQCKKARSGFHRLAGHESVAERQAKQAQILATDLHKAEVNGMPRSDTLSRGYDHVLTMQYLPRGVVVNGEGIEPRLVLADRNDHMRIDRGRALQGQSQSSLHAKAHVAVASGWCAEVNVGADITGGIIAAKRALRFGSSLSMIGCSRVTDAADARSLTTSFMPASSISSLASLDDIRCV
jgi:hypothetical protein